MVRSGPVTVDGKQVDLREHALANREELVLKPAALHGGDGVLLGWQTDPGTWADRLDETMDNPWVLQRRIRPVPEVFLTDDGSEQWLLTWGAATATCCFYQR